MNRGRRKKRYLEIGREGITNNMIYKAHMKVPRPPEELNDENNFPPTNDLDPDDSNSQVKDLESNKIQDKSNLVDNGQSDFQIGENELDTSLDSADYEDGLSKQQECTWDIPIDSQNTGDVQVEQGSYEGESGVIHSEDNVLFTTDDELEDVEVFTNARKAFKNIQELCKTDNFLRRIDRLPVTKPTESLLIILKYSLRNSLSKSQILDLLNMFNTTFGKDILPSTGFMLEKILDNNNTVEYHAVCPQCSSYLGELAEIENHSECPHCKVAIDLSKTSSNIFFMLINPSQRISQLLENNEDYYHDIVRHKFEKNKNLSDIYDGKLYRNLILKLRKQNIQNYVTSVFNTDGACKFKNSSTSVWPIFLMLNELPVHKRMEDLVLCGLWFGESKPKMTVFLRPFVTMCNKLNNSGFLANIKGKEVFIKLYAIVCCVDSVARAPMSGMLQYNGYCSCLWCKHPGEYYLDSMKFPILDTVICSRNAFDVIECMKLFSESGKIVEGINNVSPLINLIEFDIVQGMVPDYMHCVLLGVVKNITNRVLSLLNTTQKEMIDKLLISIRVPRLVTKLSRPLSDRSNWKARDWESWLLYFSVPILQLFCSTEIVEYWKLLVDSIYTLLMDKIEYNDLRQAHTNLYKFVSLTEQIWTKSAMTYNIHLLLHLCESVVNWGPLWCHSTFAFETGNKFLLRAIHAAKGVKEQVLRYISIQNAIVVLENHVYPCCSDIVKEYCSKNKKHAQKAFTFNNITYYGKKKQIWMHCKNLVSIQILVPFIQK